MRKRNDTPEKRARWNLATRYGITLEARDELIAKQGGVCAICAGPMSRAVIDHDHATGKVRGVLCHPCNIKLHALDKWPHRNAAVAYLGRGA